MKWPKGLVFILYSNFHQHLWFYLTRENWKDKITKKKSKKKERSDIVCRLACSLETLEKLERNRSSRPTLWISSAEEKDWNNISMCPQMVVGWREAWMRFSGCLCQETIWIEGQADMLFPIVSGGRKWHQGVCVWHGKTRIPEKEVDGNWCA